VPSPPLLFTILHTHKKILPTPTFLTVVLKIYLCIPKMNKSLPRFGKT